MILTNYKRKEKKKITLIKALLLEFKVCDPYKLKKKRNKPTEQGILLLEKERERERERERVGYH